MDCTRSGGASNNSGQPFSATPQAWGTPPDPKVLAFHQTYEDQRADLQAVSGSA